MTANAMGGRYGNMGKIGRCDFSDRTSFDDERMTVRQDSSSSFVNSQIRYRNLSSHENRFSFEPVFPHACVSVTHNNLAGAGHSWPVYGLLPRGNGRRKQ